ncbi:MAG: hypothetical protein ABH821_02315 [archaeon]
MKEILKKLELNKNDYIFLIIILVFILLFFKPLITSDGVGYYALTEAIFKDHTLDLANQERLDTANNTNVIEFNPITNKFVSKYPVGLALIQGPLYSLSLVLDDFSIFHIKDEFFLQERGDILIHQLAMALTHLILLFIALIGSIVILKKYFSKGLDKKKFWLIPLTVAIVFFGSSFLRYATYDISLTHAVEAGLFTILILFLLKKSSNYTSYASGLLIGFLTLIRYTSALFFLPLTVYFIIKKQYRNLALTLTGFIPFVLITLVYNLVQYGSPFSIGYGFSEGTFAIIPVHLLQILFDPARGLLFWTPLLIAGIIGLFYLRHEKKYLFLGFILMYLLFYGGYTWWEGAWGFGNRFFLVFFPLIVIGLFELIKRFKYALHVSIILMLYTFLLGLMFTAFVVEPISLWNNIDYWLLQGNILSLPQLLFEKLGIIRFLTG